MTDYASLWLPIVATGVLVFFAGALAWMVLPHHKKDWTEMPGEDRVLEAMRASGVKKGQYMFPFVGSGKESQSEAAKAKMRTGPMGIMIVWEGEPKMGPAMGMTLVYNVVVAALVAYVASMALAPGAGFGDVAKVVGVTALLANCAATIPFAIWFRKSPRSVAADLFDGVLYTAIAVVMFGLLWPGGPSIATPVGG